jgi:ParB/RepB/Spo0J family partition protein
VSRAKASPAAGTGAITYLKLAAVTPDPNQPRKAFDEKALQALADNIRERGILQPLLVRPDGDKVMIVDGERRWRAAKLAKLDLVPTLRVAEFAERTQLRIDQVSVNQLREQLKPMELARVLRGLRDAGKTPNDIASVLAKQGHPAMKPAAINDLATLTDLPEWTQAMIDKEQIEPASALPLLYVIAVEGAEKPLRKSLEQAIGYSGKLLGHHVKHSAETALEKVAINLGRVESWQRPPIVHFDWKTRCKGCEHLLKLSSGGWCQNAKLFKAHNQEAIDAGLLPGGKLPPKAKPVTGKAAEREEESKREVREASLGEKARDYLHAHLCVRLIEIIPQRTSVQIPLIVWRALKNPGSRGTRGANAIDGSIPDKYKSLEQLTAPADTKVVPTAVLDACLNIINELPWRETHLLARQIYGGSVQHVWKLDTGFLNLFRKAELVHLAVKHGCDPGGGRLWDRMKGDDIKSALLEQADKLTRPQILVDLYEGEIEKPYNPLRGWQDDEDEPGEDEDQEKAA